MSTYSFTNVICIYCVLIAMEGFLKVIFYTFFSTEVLSYLDQRKKSIQNYFAFALSRSQECQWSQVSSCVNSQHMVHTPCKQQNIKPSNQCITQAWGFNFSRIYFFIISTDLVSFFNHFSGPVGRVFLPISHKLFICYRIQLYSWGLFCRAPPPTGPKAKCLIPIRARETQPPAPRNKQFS